MTYHEMRPPSDWVRVCDDCGAVVFSTDRHDRWHEWGERYTEPANPEQQVRADRRYAVVVTDTGWFRVHGPYSREEADTVRQSLERVYGHRYGVTIIPFTVPTYEVTP